MGLGSVWENRPLAEVDLGETSGNPSTYNPSKKAETIATKKGPYFYGPNSD